MFCCWRNLCGYVWQFSFKWFTLFVFICCLPLTKNCFSNCFSFEKKLRVMTYAIPQGIIQNSEQTIELLMLSNSQATADMDRQPKNSGSTFNIMRHGDWLFLKPPNTLVILWTKDPECHLPDDSCDRNWANNSAIL